MDTASETPVVAKAAPAYCNVGSQESKVRLLGGLVAAIMATARFPLWLRIPFAIGAVAGVSTGLTRYCPMNAALGVDTCHHEHASDR